MIVFATGFEHQITPFQEAWMTGHGSPIITDVVKTGNAAARIGSVTGVGTVTLPLPTNTEYYIGFWSHTLNSNSIPVRFNGSSGPGIRRTTDGWEVVSGSTTVVGSVMGHTNDTWGHMQLHVKLDGAFSEINVIFEGHVVFNWTGTLEDANITNCFFQGGGGSIIFRIDDIVIDNNDWPGDIRFVALKPNGDTTQKDWTPSEGTDNYALVNNTDDNTYVHSDTNEARDLYTVENWSGYGLTNQVLVHWLRSRKETANTQGVRMVLKSGATTDVSSKFDLVTEFDGLLYNIHENDPNTSAPWTDSALDDIEIGQEYSE